MAQSPTRRRELIGRMTREDAFIVTFWNLHKKQVICPTAGTRHHEWERCPLYILRWGA